MRYTEIEHLFTRSNIKRLNDGISRKREIVLEASLKNLLTKYEPKSAFIKEMNANLKTTMREAFGTNTHQRWVGSNTHQRWVGSDTRMKLYHKGGRQYNHDFDLYLFSNESFKEEKPVLSYRKLEYKVVQSPTQMSIFRYPQILSVSSESETIQDILPSKESYLTFFYNHYLYKVCDTLGCDTPSLNAYIKWTKSTNKKNKDDFYLFHKLRSEYKDYQATLKQIASESIRDYLNSAPLDLKALLRMFKQKTENKHILFQCETDFLIENCDEIFNLEFLEFTDYEYQKHSLFVNTNADFTLELMLRWKNKQCCQNPAIDFRLHRL